MKYHFIINGYVPDMSSQMRQMQGFRDRYLAEMEEGETYLYCSHAVKIPGEAPFLSESVTVLQGSEWYVPEEILTLLCPQIKESDIYIFGSDYSGNELAVRAAARCNGSSAAAVHEIDTQKRVLVRKMVYSNHMEGSFLMKKGPYCISMAKGLEETELRAHTLVISEVCTSQCNQDETAYKKRETESSDSGLADAKIVLAAGRGAQNAESVHKLRQMADKIGAEFGVSRPAAMNAWAPMQHLIGVSGAMIHPNVCITAGISGAAAFYAGIEKSAFIAAINTDASAPIMKKADVVIHGDYELVLAELVRLIQEEKEENE